MGIRIFAGVIFCIALMSLIGISSSSNSSVASEEIAKITFFDAKMTTLTHERVTREIEAEQTLIYDTKEVMKDGVITTFVKGLDKNLKDVLSAKEIVKQGELFTFTNDVKFDRGELFSLRTQKLFYNQKNDRAYNKSAFTSVYQGDILNGYSLDLNRKNGTFKAEKSHFEIRMN